MQYQINDATFVLPEGLRDNTVHMFVLNDKEPKESSIVVSRADVPVTESLRECMQRLRDKLSATLSKFQPLKSNEFQYDGYPATQFKYRWSNNRLAMFQHQAVALIKSDEADHHAALMITGTCPKPFTDQS